MSYTITKKEGLDNNYFGYDAEYIIYFKFEKQIADVSIQICNDDLKNVRLYSNTDGYHWLQFFLSQEPNAKEMVEHGYNDRDICKKLFSTIGISYEQEDKESAWLNLNNDIDENIVKQIAEIIEPRFANRERFFPND